MNRMIAVAAALVVVSGLVLASGQARAAPIDIWMSDFLLLRVRCPAGGYTASERADAIEARVNDLLKLGGFDLSTIRVEKSGNDALLYANGKVLVTVDECTARANKTTPERLAHVWAERLRTIYPDVCPKRPSATRRSR